jgi:hypothetical protein
VRRGKLDIGTQQSGTGWEVAERSGRAEGSATKEVERGDGKFELGRTQEPHMQRRPVGQPACHRKTQDGGINPQHQKKEKANPGAGNMPALQEADAQMLG